MEQREPRQGGICCAPDLRTSALASWVEIPAGGNPSNMGRHYLSNATCLMRPSLFSAALLSNPVS